MSGPAFDLFIIGAGSGGVRAARMAAQRGARVAVAEDAALGGTCVNLGCIPKKLYSFAAHYAESFEESHGFGWSVAGSSFDWETLKANRRVEISRLNAVYGQILAGAGVTLMRGRARVVGPKEVEVDGVRHPAERIVVATGGWPVPADVPGGERAISSNEIFDLARFPARLAVVGGGYIASEFASIFNGLGARVTQLYRGEQILRGFDRDIRQHVAAEMIKKGVDLRLGAKVRGLEAAAGGATRIVLANGSGAVRVDDRYRSNVPSIYAIGDVIDRVQLTPVALAEAMALVDDLFGGAERHVDYLHIPTAVFTHPNIGTIGLSEDDARGRFERIRVYRSEFKPLRHTLSGSSERTMMKLVVDDANDRVVGLHMVGADAGETIQGFAVAMKAGATKAVFDATLGIHPTAAEEFVTMREPVVASS
jgi:glutathione reductase (NADPH)